MFEEIKFGFLKYYHDLPLELGKYGIFSLDEIKSKKYKCDGEILNRWKKSLTPLETNE